MSRGFILSRAAAQIWLVPLKIVFNFSRFKPALNWIQFLADLSRGSNSLNSDTAYVISRVRLSLNRACPVHNSTPSTVIWLTIRKILTFFSNEKGWLLISFFHSFCCYESASYLKRITTLEITSSLQSLFKYITKLSFKMFITVSWESSFIFY